MKKFIIKNKDIELETREAGPDNGELIILLHGFPECWNTWRHQIDPLAQAGFRVCVPNMRGYGKSSKPKEVSRYHLDELITDIEAIRQHYGKDKFHLAGHDWGGAVAWWYALHYEQHLASLCILNLPHPLAFLTKLKGSFKQIRKSWYIFYFQIPFLPEWGMKRFNFASLKTILTHTSNKGSYDAEDFHHLEEAWSEPGALTAMVNYYRAMLRNIRIPEGDGKISTPTQILWGEKDLALSLESAYESEAYLLNGHLLTYPDATHWLAHDKAEDVSNKLINHLRNHSTH